LSFIFCVMNDAYIVTMLPYLCADYFDVKTRIRIVWLNKNDQIYCTGTTPPYFGVWLLQKYTLAPRFFP
jgi:hypothetical protein